MNNWQAFINTHTMVPTDDEYICDASELGLILVNGADSESFLQNQLSNDISLIDENSFQLSAYSTPKGRMLGIFRIVKIETGYLLIMPISILPTVLQRLQMYIVQSRVTLADASAYFARFAIQSSQQTIIDNPLLPGKADQVFQNDDVISLHLGQINHRSRFLLLNLSFEQARSSWQAFSRLLQISSFKSWRLSEIKAGIPVIFPACTEQFVAQMSNLDLLGGVNFKKGCYPGQEIVARMQYLGKIKRRMFLVQLDTGICPEPGDELVYLDSEIPDGGGKVVDAVIDQHGQCFCLLIAQIKKIESNQLKLLKQPEIPIKRLDLPY